MADIRRYIPGDEAILSKLIRRTLSEVNAQDSPPDEVQWLIEHYTPETVARTAAEGHTYVITEGEAIVGTGSVIITGPEECEIVAAFLLPEAIGRGLGTRLFDTLEGDEWSRAAKRIWLTSSVLALDFYEKRGYVNPNGYRVRGADKMLTMEKRKP